MLNHANRGRRSLSGAVLVFALAVLLALPGAAPVSDDR